MQTTTMVYILGIHAGMLSLEGIYNPRYTGTVGHVTIYRRVQQGNHFVLGSHNSGILLVIHCLEMEYGNISPR